MKKALKIFTVNGTGIYLHWTFIFLAAWILIMQAVTRASLLQTVWAFLAVIAMFGCVVLHELGHALVAAWYGIRTKDIKLLPIGGLANMEKLPDKPQQEIAISVAGPAVNLLIAVLTLPFLDIYVPFWRAAFTINNVQPANFLYYLHTVNMILAVFNLIPAFPLDGGRVLRGVLGLLFSYDRATYIAVLTGRLIAGFFIVFGLLTFNLVLPVIGGFIIFAGSAEEQFVYLRSAAKGLRLRELVIRDYAALDAGLSVKEAAERLLQCHYRYFAVTEGHVPIGVIDRNEIIDAVANGQYDAQIRQLVPAGSFSLNEESLANDAIDKFIQKGPAVYPVVDDGHLTGIVNLESVVEYLLIHNIGVKGFPGAGALARLLH